MTTPAPKAPYDPAKAKMPPYDPAKVKAPLTAQQRSDMKKWLDTRSEQDLFPYGKAAIADAYAKKDDKTFVAAYQFAVGKDKADKTYDWRDIVSGEPLRDAVSDVADTITAPIEFLGKLGAAIFSVQFWIRVAEMIIAFLLIAAGLAKLANGTALGRGANKALRPVKTLRKGN